MSDIIYETTKEREATILIPSSMVNSLNPSAATLSLALGGRSEKYYERQSRRLD